MSLVKTAFAICALLFLNLSVAYAIEDMDWTVEFQPVHEAGPDTPVVGKRWTVGAIRGDIIFSIHLDAQPDMMRGNWHGDIRSLERFYVQVFTMDEAGTLSGFGLQQARAVGPDADYGSWKEGPATADVQAMQFDFTRDRLMDLKSAQALAIVYTSFDDPEDKRTIVFPMETLDARLSELDQSIRSEGGEAYLMTSDEIENTPIRDLPAAVGGPTEEAMARVSADLSVPVSELMAMTITEVTARVEGRKTADREAERAARRAAHQAIYDQTPDWMDLNVCPKPDVSYCNNVGRLAYEKDEWFDEEYDYGKIVGVVWRSEGSIVHIYGGSIDLGIEPEIHRASSAGHYYITRNDEDDLQIRSCDGMFVR